jgi:hypothetical protein
MRSKAASLSVGHKVITLDPNSSELSDWIQYLPGRHQQIRYNPAQPQEITIDDLNARSFREPLRLGGWGAGLILIGLALRR